ncbi:MAG TPA: YiiX/YebB-like N1pC/P60 family cysteine hydrolase [Pedobacter sp.]
MNTKKTFLILTFLFIAFFAPAQKRVNTLQDTQLKAGDLIFQDLACGPLCDAINAVTQGYQGNKFSHMGMVYLRHDSILVIEASGKNVHLTPLKDFLARSVHPHYVGRIKSPYRKLIPAALGFSIRQMGVPYDDQYLYGNGKYYCSELIYDSFLSANRGRPFFQLFPMTYKEPGSDKFFPVWKAYFDNLKMEVPEGKPGCNPGGISLSDKIDILGQLK